jgi:hypothetical protein
MQQFQSKTLIPPTTNIIIQLLQQIKTTIIYIFVKLYEQYFKFRNPDLYLQLKKNFDEKQQEKQTKRQEQTKRQQEIQKQTQQTIQFAKKNQTYIDKMKNKFQKTFETTEQKIMNWNENISPIFYSNEYKTIDFYILDNHPKLIEEWTAKQLIRMYWNDIQPTNVVMNYLPEKNKFNVYSSVNIKTDFLNAMAMEYVMLFRCRGFFGDLTQVPEEYHKQYVGYIDETSKKQNENQKLTSYQLQQREKLEKLFVKKKEKKTENVLSTETNTNTNTNLRKNIFCQNKMSDWQPLRIKKEFINVSVRDEYNLVHTMVVPKTTKYRDYKHKMIMDGKIGIIDYKQISVPDYDTKYNAYHINNPLQTEKEQILTNTTNTTSNFFATFTQPKPTLINIEEDQEDTDQDDRDQEDTDTDTDNSSTTTTTTNDE